MHRLVSEVRRVEVLLERESSRWLKVFERLGNWFEARREEFSDRPSYDAELDHLEVWQGMPPAWDMCARPRDCYGYVLIPITIKDSFSGLMMWLQRALALFEGAAIVDLKLEAHLCNDFGNTLNSIGKHSEALDFSQRALRIRREVLGESHLILPLH